MGSVPGRWEFRGIKAMGLKYGRYGLEYGVLPSSGYGVLDLVSFVVFVDNGIESEVVAGLSEEFQEGNMVDALSRVEQKSSENWKELDNESEDRKVERDAEREGEPTILA
ncbi:hypothetical protein Tco_1327635 [Tanacetum coccineum]